MKRERGNTLVEFALVLPIFFFILFTLIELVFVAHNYLIVTSAAQEAARIGATGGSDQEIMKAVDTSLDRLINTYLLKGIIPEDGVIIHPGISERRVGRDLVVKINYRVLVNIGWIGIDILGLDLPARAQMPMEMDLG